MIPRFFEAFARFGNVLLVALKSNPRIVRQGTLQLKRELAISRTLEFGRSFNEFVKRTNLEIL